MMRRLAPAGSFALPECNQRAGRYASADVRSRVRAVQEQQRAITKREQEMPQLDTFEPATALKLARAAMRGRR